MRRSVRRPAAAKAGLRRPAAAPLGGQKPVLERWTEGLEIRSEEFTPGLFGRVTSWNQCKPRIFGAECGSSGGPDWDLYGRAPQVRVCTAPSCGASSSCGEGCDQRRTNPDLIHLQKFCQLRPGDEKETDENAELRRQQAEWERQRDAGEEDQEGPSASRDKKKKNKEAKARKKGRRRSKR